MLMLCGIIIGYILGLFSMAFCVALGKIAKDHDINVIDDDQD